MSEKKLLPDVTRRDVLKGIGKGAALTQAPAISGLSSLVKGIKTGLDINKKLDLTKNILQELLSLANQAKEGDDLKYRAIKFAVTKLKEIQEQDQTNPYALDSDDYMQEEKNIQEREERFFPNEEPDVKEIINFIKNNNRNLKITNNDVVRILDTVEKENKLLNTAKKYDLPLQYMLSNEDKNKEINASNYQRDKSFLKNFLQNQVKNFDDKIRPKFLKEYNTPDEEIFKGYIGAHGGKFRQQELFNKLHKEMINKYGIEEAMYAGEREGPRLTTKVDYNDPLVKEYRNISFMGQIDPDDHQAMYEASIDSIANDPQSIETKYDSEIVNYVKDIAGDFFKDYAGKKLKEVFEKQPQKQVKQLPEPEAIEVEVQNKKEIPIQAEQETPVPPGSLGKILKKTPYIGGVLTAITPTQMGDAELKIKDQQGNIIQKRKGGTVIKNYYKNYNTQRTI
jgi:hypothetical protein